MISEWRIRCDRQPILTPTTADPTKTHFTYQDALEQIQASEKELERGLKEKRILILDSRETFMLVSFISVH